MRFYEIDKTPQTLNYQTPPPRPGKIELATIVLEHLVDSCGGFGWFLFFLSLTMLEAALFIKGIIGLALFLVAVGIWYVLVDRWSKSSRWF